MRDPRLRNWMQNAALVLLTASALFLPTTASCSSSVSTLPTLSGILPALLIHIMSTSVVIAPNPARRSHMLKNSFFPIFSFFLTYPLPSVFSFLTVKEPFDKIIYMNHSESAEQPSQRTAG